MFGLTIKLYHMVSNVYVGANSPTYPKGWDGADAIAEGWGKEQIDELISLALPYATKPEKQKRPEPIDLDAMELWHTSGDDGYLYPVWAI